MRVRAVSVLIGAMASLLVLSAMATSALAQGGACQPLITVDAPRPNAALEGTATVGGWAIDRATASGTQTGIQDVMIYRDGPPNAGGIVLGTAAKVMRPDVNAVLGLAPGTQAGWTLDVDLSSVPSGPHTIYVAALTACGWVAETVPIAVSGATEITVDSPANGQTVAMGQRIDIGGWAVDPDGPGTGVSQVMVYLDAPGDAGGTLLGTATYGKARPDVASAKGRSEFVNSGFDLLWTVSGVAPGRHVLYVHARSTAGSTASRAVEINVAGTQAPSTTAYDDRYGPGYNQGYYNPGYNQGYYGSGYNQGYYNTGYGQGYYGNSSGIYGSDYLYSGYDNPYYYNNYYGNVYGSGGCPSGYTRSVTGQCIYTGYGYGYGSGYCPAGYTMIGSQCIYTGGTGYGFGNCQAGYYWNGSTCVFLGGSTGTCPAGFVLSGQQCVYNGSFSQGSCPAGFVYLNGTCYRV